MKPVLSLLIFAITSVAVSAGDAVYAPWPATTVREQVLLSVQRQTADATTLEAVKELWAGQPTQLSPEATLRLAVQSWVLADPALSQFLPDAEALDPRAIERLTAALDAASPDPFRQTNLRAYSGRALAEQRMYDEALEKLRSVDVPQTIDPAAALFFRAAAAQSVLEFDLARDSLNDLLQKTQSVPPRYRTTAELMLAELGTVKERSLDEIARLMADSERRLELGRAGERVQGVQERIVSELDELIKKLEAQAGGGSGSGAGGRSNESSNPANDSVIKGSTAPGETDQRKFSKQGEWGDLPPGKQAEAKNIINRNYPSHYRQAIETYFRKLATRPAAPEK